MTVHAMECLSLEDMTSAVLSSSEKCLFFICTLQGVFLTTVDYICAQLHGLPSVFIGTFPCEVGRAGILNHVSYTLEQNTGG